MRAKSVLRKKSKKANKPIILKTDSEAIKKTKIRIIGIGGGGGTIVSEIAADRTGAIAKTRKASFVIANTDRQALKTTSRKAIHFQFGQLLTQGLGTGMNADLAAEASLNEKEKIKKLLENQDLCVLVVCLGGGAGSGAAPIFAKISKQLGNLTYGIFILPFAFEGKKKMEIARAALEKLKKEVDILSIIPNEKIFQIIDKKTPLKQALSAINKNLAKSLGGLIETIYDPGLINIDFADLRTIFQGPGKLAYLNTIEVQRKQSLAQGLDREVTEKTINNPLYPYGIRGASRILFNIAGGKELRMDEVSQILTAVSELANKEAKIIFGIKQNKKETGIITVSLLAVGCSQKNFFDQLDESIQSKTKPATQAKRRAEERTKFSLTEKPKNRLKKNIVKSTKKNKSKKEEFKKEVIPLRPLAEENKTAAVVPANDKIRKNALQIKKESEEVEKEMLEKEKFWEAPAFLRKKQYE